MDGIWCLGADVTPEVDNSGSGGPGRKRAEASAGSGTQGIKAWA